MKCVYNTRGLKGYRLVKGEDLKYVKKIWEYRFLSA